MWTVEFVHVLSLCLTSYNNYLCTDSRFLIEHGTLHQYYIFNFSLYLPPFDIERGRKSCLCCLCVFAYSGVTHVLTFE